MWRRAPLHMTSAHMVTLATIFSFVKLSCAEIESSRLRGPLYGGSASANFPGRPVLSPATSPCSCTRPQKPITYTTQLGRVAVFPISMADLPSFINVDKTVAKVNFRSTVSFIACCQSHSHLLIPPWHGVIFQQMIYITTIQQHYYFVDT